MRKIEPALTYQFRVTLIDSDPPIWRRFVVPSDYSFNQLHLSIQGAFGWENVHLFQFSQHGFGDRKSIGIPYPEMDEFPVENAELVSIHRVFKKAGDRFTYIYDFGDNWEHEVVLENISKEEITRAYCLEGENNCPPDDVGGIGGYQEMLEVFKTPRHPEKGRYREWLGLGKKTDWDPAYFDLKETNKRLALL